VEHFPAVRASAVRDTLHFLDKFEPGTRAKVMERVPAASREVIESTPRSSWIGVEHDHFTVDAMIEVLGRRRAIECWRDSVADLVDKPLLKTFVSGMVALIGHDPSRIVGLFAKGWPLVYRGLCEPRLIATSGRHPVIRFDHLAPELRLYRNYFDSWDGACQGFAHLAKVTGYVHFSVAPDVSFAEARFSWD
jgi:hypothetical protein